MVVFRITEEQHTQLKAACSREGARSLSEFARSSVLRALGEPSLAGLAQAIEEIRTSVEQLAETVLTPKS
jgi:hypothetical protein